jgi:hypothetical protein
MNQQKTTESCQTEAKIKTRILEELAKYKNPLEVYKMLKQQATKSDAPVSGCLSNGLSFQKAFSEQKNLIISPN